MRRSASGGVPRQLAGLVRGDGLHTHDLPPYDQRAERPYDHSALGPVGNRQSLVSSPSHPQVSPRLPRQRSEPGSAPTDADQDNGSHSSKTPKSRGSTFSPVTGPRSRRFVWTHVIGGCLRSGGGGWFRLGSRP